MGLLSDLFGTQQVQTQVGVPKFQEDQYRYIFDQARDLYNQGGLSQVAPFTPAQQQGQQSAIDYASNFNFAPASNALNYALSGPVNPYTSGLIQSASRPLIENFREQILPSLRLGSLNAGQYGGSRGGIAEGIAAKGLINQLGDVSTRLSSNAFDIGNRNLLQGLNLAPSIAGLGLLPSQILSNVGGVQQAQQQAQLDQPYTNLSRLYNLSNANVGQVQTQPVQGPGGALLGGLAGNLLGDGGLEDTLLGMSFGGLI
jgi:hypothetical protein